MRNIYRLISCVIVILIAVAPGAEAQVSVGVSVGVAPPPLPVYVQPPLPAPGYIWTPGHWAYANGDYYWVPGTWVMPPAVGLCGRRLIGVGSMAPISGTRGYWGPHVGFYGEINYGFGYTGIGFAGGFWAGGVFSYNRAVNNFGSVHVTNVYNKTVVNNVTVNRTSYNGGAGGVTATPNAEERAAAAEHHVAPTRLQERHMQTAAATPRMRASVNNGKPAVAATRTPGQFQRQASASPHPQNRPPSPRHENPRGNEHAHPNER